MFFIAGEKFGEDETLEAIREAGKTNEPIEAYRLEMLAAKQKHSGAVRPESYQPKYSEFRPKLFDAARLKISPHGWGSKASTEDLELAACDLENAITAEVQVRYLRIFARRRFPLHHAPLLRLTLSADDQVARAAAIALAQIDHLEVREMAFRLMQTGSVGRKSSIMMLVRNWRQGDHEIVLRWFEQEVDRWIRHGFVHDLRAAWNTHPDLESEVGMLLMLYEKGTCSLCREDVVSRLIELDALPPAIRAECAFDSNDEIRVLVGAGSGV